MKKILTIALLLSTSVHAMQHSRLNSAKQYLQSSGVNLSNLQKVLVIGCGNGDIPIFMEKKISDDGTVIALDGSGTTIERAREKHDSAGHANLTFQREVLQTFDLGWPAELAVSFAALHFMRNQQSILERIAQALQPNGTFHLIMDAKDDQSILHTAIKETIEAPAWASRFKIPLAEVHQPCTQAQLDNMLAQAGFGQIESNTKTEQYQFKTKDEFIHWLLDWSHGMPSIAHFEDDARSQLANEIAQKYLNKKGGYKKSRHIDLAFAVITAHAKKNQEENL